MVPGKPAQILNPFFPSDAKSASQPPNFCFPIDGDGLPEKAGLEEGQEDQGTQKHSLPRWLDDLYFVAFVV